MRLLILFLLVFPSLALAGDTTSNGYFYVPGYGATGQAERTNWYNAMQATDAVIEANKDHRVAEDAVTGIIKGNGAGGYSAATAGTDYSLPNGWTDGGTNMYQTLTTDNVAIGTTTPSTKFHVKGDATIDGSVIIPGASSIVFDNGVTLNGLIPSVLGITGGSLGIGTVSPTRLFHVKSTISAGTASAPASVIEREVSLTDTLAIVTQDRLLTTGTAAMDFGLGKDILLEDDSGSLNQTFRTTYFWEDATNGSEDAYSTDLIMSAGSLVTNWYRSSTGLMRFNDTTGAAPAAVVDIKQESSSVPYLRAFSGTSTAQFVVDGNANVGIGTGTPVGGLAVMRGNVGIGTWSPRAGIEVGSAGTINNAGSGDSVYIQNDLEVDGSIFLADGTELNDSGDLGGGGGAGGWTDGGANVYTSSTADNVGIGTTTPTAFLDISSTAAQNLLMVNDNGIGDTTPFLVNSVGNVGIGTSNPSAALAIGPNSDLRINSTGINRINATSMTLSETLLTLNSTGTAIISNSNSTSASATRITGGGATNSALVLDSTSTSGTADRITFTVGNDLEAARFTTSGNMGIGTTTPRGALTVMSGNVGIGTTNPLGTFAIQPAAAQAGQATCWTTNGVIGYCTSTVGAGGDCTCVGL